MYYGIMMAPENLKTESARLKVTVTGGKPEKSTLAQHPGPPGRPRDLRIPGESRPGSGRGARKSR